MIPLAFLKRCETLNSQLYVQPLQYAHESLVEKTLALVNRKNILHDETKPHKVRKIGKIVLTKLVYSNLIRHIAIDYFLFRSMQNTLIAKTFFGAAIPTE